MEGEIKLRKRLGNPCGKCGRENDQHPLEFCRDCCTCRQCGGAMDQLEVKTSTEPGFRTDLCRICNPCLCCGGGNDQSHNSVRCRACYYSRDCGVVRDGVSHCAQERPTEFQPNPKLPTGCMTCGKSLPFTLLCPHRLRVCEDCGKFIKPGQVHYAGVGRGKSRKICPRCAKRELSRIKDE